MNRILRIAVLLVLTTCFTSHAGPVLVARTHAHSGAVENELSVEEGAHSMRVLARMDVNIVGGVAHIIDSFRPVLFYLDVAEPRSSILFEGFPGPVSFPGQASGAVSVDNDSEFHVFSELMTNGIDQFVIPEPWNEDLGVLGLEGTGVLESDLELFVPSFGVDLTGYRVELISQALAVDIQSPGSDPFGDGVWTDFRISGAYEFHGSIIPEPCTVIMLLVGLAGATTGRRRRPNHRGPNIYNATLTEHVDPKDRECNANCRSTVCVALIICMLSIFAQDVAAQCQTNGSDTQPGLGGSDQNPHPFSNRCLAASGTNVTITIEAMADLGCNSWDATHNLPVGGQCPNSCTPICCDTSATSKYVTVTGNSNTLSPSISGSTNMPTGGRFFQNWNTDCYTSSQSCLEAGRSPCDPNNPAANKRVVTIPASTWNAWLGFSGNTMTIRVTSTSAVHSAPDPTRSLALYCEELGFNLCPFQSCSGLCGPDTFSRVSISYSSGATCTPTCVDTACQFRECQNGQCNVTGNKPAGTACGSSSNTQCTNPDTCNGSGTCLSNHASSGTLCGDQTDDDCTDPDTCNGFGSCQNNNASSGTPCPDGDACNGQETCSGTGNCVGAFNADCNGNINEDACDITEGTSEDCNENTIPDECDISSGTSSDCDMNTVPDECDITNGAPDCNENTILDECDLADGAPDCNNNMIPDECEPDCDADATPDDCAINDGALDCNENTIPDECDISSGASDDCDMNTVPDECELVLGPLPAAAPHNIPKNRFISFEPACNAQAVAYRVELVDQGLPIVLGWVSDPFVPMTDDTPAGTFTAKVQSTMPALRVWTEQVIHVGDCEIAPVRTYLIQATDGITFSSPLEITTIAQPAGKFWGDMVGSLVGGVWTEPNGIVNVDDLAALLTVIRTRKDPSAPPAPHVTVVDLAGEVPNFKINASDLQEWLRAFGGGAYPPPAFLNQGGPEACPESGSSPPPIGDPADFSLIAGSTTIDAGQTVNIEVFITPMQGSNIPDLAGYEVALDVSGGASGSLTLTSTDLVDEAHPDYVFAAAPSVTGADNATNARAIKALNSGGTLVQSAAYLATYTFQASSDAAGIFMITVRPGSASFLLDSDGFLLSSSLGSGLAIGVGVECTIDTECDDGNVCTSDTCEVGTCANTNNTISCNDGNACTTGDACSGGSCSGTPINCSDGNGCTNDYCSGGVCHHYYNTNPCNDTDLCTQGDICADGECAGSDVECPQGETCDPADGVCKPCLNNAGCDDGNICTTDTCVSNICENTNNTASCNDADSCTTGDVCSGGLCAGSPLNCDDWNVCTDDSCVSGTCQHTNNAASCSDGNACTLNDFCSGGTCTSEFPVSCPFPQVCNTRTGLCQ